MTIEHMAEKKKIFLTNGLGELTGKKEVKPEHYNWYERLSNDSELFLNYLIEEEGVVGMLSIKEFLHPGMDNWTEQKNNLGEYYQNKSSKQIMEMVSLIAKSIERETSYKVYVGYETGFMGCHEFAIFVPYTEKNVEIQKVFKKINELSE